MIIAEGWGLKRWGDQNVGGIWDDDDNVGLMMGNEYEDMIIV